MYKEGKGREGKGREGKGREGKGREGKGREGKGRKGREGKGREGKGREGKGREGKGREGKQSRRNKHSDHYGCLLNSLIDLPVKLVLPPKRPYRFWNYTLSVLRNQGQRHNKYHQ